MTGCLMGLLAAILLPGATGGDLRARAYVDAHNATVGDPLTLTVDFLGDADFRSLHPPALSRAVDRRDWRLDDASAKTDTFRDARRLTYRLRPVREGLLWFPALEFEYAGPDGSVRRAKSNAFPVHARAGSQVEVAELDDESAAMPEPPELVEADYCRHGLEMSDDERFRWRRAMAKPDADAFAEFDFPAARMNEAACALRAGNWARAASVYSRLEWRIGQTPEIERGIVAALARRFGNPRAELPMWRQALRPLLRHALPLRCAIVLGGFAALALLLWLLGKGVNAVACFALALGLAAPASAQGLFEEMEEQMRQMRRQMQQSFGGLGFGAGSGAARQIGVKATLALDRDKLRMGEPFEFVLSLEYPRTASVGQIRIVPSSDYGLVFTAGGGQNLADGEAANPSNVLKRIAFPARYDVPYRGKVAFAVEGMASGRETRNGGRFSYTFSNSFRTETNPLAVEVLPLPDAGQPEDFSGIVSEGLRLHEYCDRLRVETNDIVTVTYRMQLNGFVPADYLVPGSAFEWTRRRHGDGRAAEIEYRRFVVADGKAETPRVKVSWYDPRSRGYKTAEAGGTPLTYRGVDGGEEK